VVPLSRFPTVAEVVLDAIAKDDCQLFEVKKIA
jgi:hypothetical protein